MRVTASKVIIQPLETIKVERFCAKFAASTKDELVKPWLTSR